MINDTGGVTAPCAGEGPFSWPKRETVLRIRLQSEKRARRGVVKDSCRRGGFTILATGSLLSRSIFCLVTSLSEKILSGSSSVFEVISTRVEKVGI